MTRLRIDVVTTEQRDAILELVRWFDNNSSSLHHALIMAAQRNEQDASTMQDEAPWASQMLRESSQSWRQHATNVLALTDKLGERIGEVDDLNIHEY
jgi:hypothetical protein